MAKIDFGGTQEEVITRKEFPMARARKVLKNEVIAIIGYGVQGPAQALNLRDNGFNVIIGQAQEFKRDWDRAVADGWKPGKTLFPIEEAVQRGHHHPVAALRRRPARWSGRRSRRTSRTATRCISRTASPSPTTRRPASCRRRMWT
jgi:hypothetical protein